MAFGKVLLNSGLLSIAMIVFSTAIENNSIINEPNYIKALHYDIKVRLYIKRNIYIGECNATIHINHETSNITMHFPTFGIIKVVLIDKNQTIYIPRYFVDRYSNTVKLDFTHLSEYGNFSLLPDIYNLKMTYLLSMLYRFKKSYLGTNGDKIMARIGTEVIKAQQLIPWPTTISTWQSKQAFKATFNISVKHHHSYNVLSNMPVQTKYEDKNDMLWTRFQQLPLMSVKHLMIAITTFSNIVLLPNIQFWCKLDMTNFVKIATTAIKDVATFLFTSNFTTKVSKLDYVLTDDSYNRVKTRGLILERSADIIYDEKIDSTMRKLQIAHLIASQMAFLWYDNVAFWSKSNFQLFFGVYVLDQIQQSKYVMDLFVVQTQQEFFRFITPSYANPLLATNRSTINISKNNLHLRNIKFFAIWRMLHYLISDNIFWKSIKKFINTYNYSETTISQSSLWPIMNRIIKSQNSELNMNIKSIINIWITKTYYPVLKVMRDYKNNIANIVYITSSDVIDKIEENWIPVSYTVQSSLNFEKQRTNNFFLLNSRNRSHRIEGINQNDWIIINLQQIGYYRVNYDFENWNKLAHYLRNAHSNINVLNRAQIIDDAYYFLLQQELDYDTFWYVTSFLAQDTNYIAWYPMIKAFEHMMCIFSITHSKNTEAKMQKILNKIILQIGYYEKKDDTDLTKYLREEIIKWTCVLHIPECRRIANIGLKKEIAKFQAESYTYLPSKEWVYCQGATVANESSLDSLWYMWESTSNTKFLEFMACFENSNIIFRYLKQIKNAKQIELKAQYAYIFLLTVAKHVKNDMILTMILENLYTNFNLSKSVETIATLIVIITHTHYLNNHYKIENFVKLYYPRKEQLFQAVKNKIRNRKLEYARLIGNYKLLSQNTYH